MVSVAAIVKQLAPTGVLRAAVNLSNPLLIESWQPLAGLSPAFAAAIAARLEVPLELIPYEHPDTICMAAEEWHLSGDSPSKEKQPWDIALIAADPDREQVIDFTPAYCEIRATCLVPASSSIRNFEDVNREGVRLSTKGGGAYDLWVTRNWTKPTILRSRTLEESYLAYVDDGLEVLAGLRPRLLEDLERDREGHRLLEGSFMSVKQAIGCIKEVDVGEVVAGGTSNEGMSPGHEFLHQFVEEARAPGGLVEELIQKHGATGRLSLPTVRN